jgi:hypothetical protein
MGALDRLASRLAKGKMSALDMRTALIAIFGPPTLP